MKHEHKSIPHLDQLMANYLENSAVSLDTMTEVEPHEIWGGFRAEAKTSWIDTTSIFRLFGITGANPAMPTEWNTLVSQAMSRFDLPCCVGTFPQQVPEFARLWQASVAEVSASVTREQLDLPQLIQWCHTNVEAKKPINQATSYLLACYLGTSLPRPECVASELVKNQEAALLWLNGERTEAIQVWESLPDHPVVRYNLGMAYWSLGNYAAAKPHWEAAATEFPETSGWQHLAEVYLILTERAINSRT